MNNQRWINALIMTDKNFCHPCAAGSHLSIQQDAPLELVVA